MKTVALVTSLLLLSVPAVAADAPPLAEQAHVTWDLTELYPTDAAWEAERNSIAGAFLGLAGLKGSLGK